MDFPGEGGSGQRRRPRSGDGRQAPGPDRPAPRPGRALRPEDFARDYPQAPSPGRAARSGDSDRDYRQAASPGRPARPEGPARDRDRDYRQAPSPGRAAWPARPGDSDRDRDRDYRQGRAGDRGLDYRPAPGPGGGPARSRAAGRPAAASRAGEAGGDAERPGSRSRHARISVISGVAAVALVGVISLAAPKFGSGAGASGFTGLTTTAGPQSAQQAGGAPAPAGGSGTGTKKGTPGKSSSSSSGGTPPVTKPPITISATAQKGVGVTQGAGVSASLAASRASWFYDWGATPAGIATPGGSTFVPMVWGASDVTPSVLSEVKQEGSALLTFNEPDVGDQANMSVSQAISLWPKLEATGMYLGSPAVSYGTNSTSGWLGQFMQQAQAKNYRVDFITVHWYGQSNFSDPAANVNELQSYLEQTYILWGKPIWLTEFALTDFQSGPNPVYPTAAQQAAFLTAATKMLSTLPYVQRYAWYGLSMYGTALFTSTSSPTAAGTAFENAP